MGVQPRGRRVSAMLGIVAMLAGAAPAIGQTRAADPRDLIDAWTAAPAQERRALALAITERRAEMLPVLRQTARAGARRERMFALAMLAELRDRDGLDAVLAASSDGDVKIRRRAATVLRILADPRAASRLRTLARTENDTGVLKTTLAALGRLGQAGDVSVIEPFLSHPDEGVRVVAAGALAMLGDERGLGLVIDATESADPGVQKSATYALGLFRDPAAGERLEEILADPDGAWKSYAQVAQAERSLAGRPADEQVAALGAFAQGRSRTLAEWAVDRLTDIGTPQAVAELRAASNRSTPVGGKAERRLRVLGGGQ